VLYHLVCLYQSVSRRCSQGGLGAPRNPITLFKDYESCPIIRKKSTVVERLQFQHKMLQKLSSSRALPGPT